MDFGEDDEFGMEKGNDDHLNYQNSRLSAEWRFGNQSVGTFSEHLIANSGTVPVGKPVPMRSRLDVGGLPAHAGSGVLPPSLSYFPTDSAFIERAARFSCFNGGNFSGMVNSFSASESSSSYSNAMKGIPGAFIQKSEINMAEAFKDVSLPVDHGSNSDASMNLHGVQVSSNGSGEPESSWGGQEEIACAIVNSSSKGLGAKKRRRNTQDMELGQLEGTQQFSIGDSKEIIATMATPKPSGKAKDCSDATKEDYVHVRARRGQATNSHSLAERLRREKISERMKYLQDLVPGCSKVTGKAVMLDEIINYVQSLQRQVELLSMKLAAVNPSLEFNIDGLLSKNFLQSWGSCSPIGFSNDIMHSQLHPPQQGFVQAGMNGITNHSGALGRVINAQIAIMSGNKEPTPQMHNAWDDELHNIIQMNLGTANPPLNTPELKGLLRDGFPS